MSLEIPEEIEGHQLSFPSDPSQLYLLAAGGISGMINPSTIDADRIKPIGTNEILLKEGSPLLLTDLSLVNFVVPYNLERIRSSVSSTLPSGVDKEELLANTSLRMSQNIALVLNNISTVDNSEVIQHALSKGYTLTEVVLATAEMRGWLDQGAGSRFEEEASNENLYAQRFLGLNNSTDTYLMMIFNKSRREALIQAITGMYGAVSMSYDKIKIGRQVEPDLEVINDLLLPTFGFESKLDLYQYCTKILDALTRPSITREALALSEFATSDEPVLLNEYREKLGNMDDQRVLEIAQKLFFTGMKEPNARLALEYRGIMNDLQSETFAQRLIYDQLHRTIQKRNPSASSEQVQNQLQKMFMTRRPQPFDTLTVGEIVDKIFRSEPVVGKLTELPDFKSLDR